MCRFKTLYIDTTICGSLGLYYRQLFIIICFNLAIISSGSVYAKNPFEAQSSSIDYTIYKMASEQNDAASQYLLGKKYLYGKTVKKNVNEAIKWFERAAEQNHNKAQFILGKLYLDGKKIPQNYAFAKTYLTLASKNNHVEAQYELGNYYMQVDAEGLQPNKALKWYRAAAGQKHGAALYAAGIMLYEGKGVKTDQLDGKYLLRLSVETGYIPAIKYYSNLSKEIDPKIKQAMSTTQKPRSKPKPAPKAKTKPQPKSSIVKKPTSKRKSKTEKKALKALTQYELGLAYLYGNGREKNLQSALDWLDKAAKNDSADAQYQLGIMYKEGIGVRKNQALAIDWFKHAALSGSEEALTELDISVYDNLYQQALKKADDERAATANAKFAMALLYLNGDTLKQNSSMAFKWALEAAELNQAEAQIRISKMYRDGIGVNRNITEANRWKNIATNGQTSKILVTKHSNKTINEPPEQPNKLPQNKTPIIQQTTKVKPAPKIKKPTIATTTEINDTRPDKNNNLQGNVDFQQDRNTTPSNTNIPQNTHYRQLTEKDFNTLLLRANNGDSIAMYGLGIYYIKNRQASVDGVITGIEWLERAADERNLSAQRWLGDINLRGKIVEINYFEASKWYLRAAKQGDAISQYVIAGLYKKGLGVERNNALAIKWYRKAATQGHQKARRQLGECRIC